MALTLTGATALCDLVARRRRNAPPPGKIPGIATAYRGYSVVRFGSPEKAQCAASGENPRYRYRLPGLLNGTKVRTLTHRAFAQAGFQLVVLIDHVLFRRTLIGNPLNVDRAVLVLRRFGYRTQVL